MKLKTVAAFGICSLALVACGGDPDVVVKGANSGASEESAPASASESAPAAKGQLLESGFGQQDEYVNGVALVKNDSDHAGQTVTASFNFLDADGNVVGTVSQVDSFNFPGQTIAVQGSTDVPNKQVKVASVEPTLLVEDDGLFDTTDVDFGVVEATLQKKYGSTEARVEVVNPTAEALQSPAVRVACRDAAGKINGGGFTFPDLVPPNGKIVADVSLIVSGDPASCTGYIGGPI